MRSFIGVDRLQIQHMPDDVILICHAIAAMHVASDPRNIQRLAAIIALHHRDGLGRRFAAVHQPPEPERAR